ncbi:hypothetical protein PR202_gb10300 [Eleusine coracana subsp. coracana]|uniref:Prohibitin n=1 Tax=Eleusine coracana subsp. coracana TaxID=191504 RepID=A0AAV5EKB0_ELECO|nr:hypothetical protein PR202_gb10300 [Eleusine coracana subsp. coracana]
MSFKGAKMPSAPGAGGKLATVAVLGGAALYGVLNSFYNVEGGHRAIVFNRLEGIKEKVYPEGTHLMIPWFERPIIYDVRARPNLVESTSGSRDLQMAVSREIRKILTERAKNFNIALDDVSITSLSFGKEFTHAIEAKQVAAQEAERAKFIVEKAEQDKRSAVIRAQGEAKSAELIGQAIANNPAFLALRQIEAAREISHTMASSNNRVYLDSSDLLLGLQQLSVMGKQKKSAVVFEVGGEAFAAHRCVLAARSPVISGAILAAAGVVRVDGVRPRVFRALLRYAYTDALPEMDEDEPWTLLLAST